jgi:hypothetical protein
MRLSIIALLEEELPRGNGRADDGDHQQHEVREIARRREPRHDKIVPDHGERRMSHQEDRH